MGHVRRIERDEIILDEGRVPTSERTLHVHCAARGLARRPLRPIFEPGRVTIQPIFWGFACYQNAMLGVVEAAIESDEEKNRLCPPIANWNKNTDYLAAFLAGLANNRARAAHPAVASWAKTTRLNPFSGIALCRDDPGIRETHARIARFGAEAANNIVKLLGASSARPGANL